VRVVRLCKITSSIHSRRCIETSIEGSTCKTVNISLMVLLSDFGGFFFVVVFLPISFVILSHKVSIISSVSLCFFYNRIGYIKWSLFVLCRRFD
jgi:hypothetical protein